MIIHSYFTTGLCGTCYRELPAQIEYRHDNAAYITKTCPVHGYEEAMVERDWKFWHSATQITPDNYTWNNYNNVGLIEVTDRCNLLCKHCYHSPDNSISDQSAEWIIKKASTIAEPGVCLMGAEPTVRDDLSEIIKGISKANKQVSIYTNGVRLHDKQYFDTLIEAGLTQISISVHHPTYHKNRIWEIVNSSLSYIVNSPLNFGQISFTIENQSQVNDVLDKILFLGSLDKSLTNFCIRTPAKIGLEFDEEKEVFASELFGWLQEECALRNLYFVKRDNYGSNPYHVGVSINDLHIQVIHWANVKSLDTSYMYMGPWAYFIPNTRGTFLLQAILRDGWKKGWWQGQRLIDP